MFAAVAPEEIAFAMSLFVGAVNGQVTPLRNSGEQADEQSGERFFLDLAGPVPVTRAEVLQNPLFQAFRTVWLEYRLDDRRESIAARVLGFSFLMERTRGAILRPVQVEAMLPETLVVLHPAVVEAVSAVELSAAGVLSLVAFTSALERVVPSYADLNERVPGAGTDDETR